MRAKTARWRLPACLVVVMFLGAGPSLEAQNPQPRSTTNPRGGLYGAPTWGLATFGSSRRGISDRPLADRGQRPLVPAPESGAGAAGPPSGAAPAGPGGPGAAPGAGAPPAGSPGAARPAAAPRPPRFPPESTEWERAAARPRLLTLASGEVLRVRARWKTGRWHYLTDDGWRALPSWDVVRETTERDALALMRERLRHVDRADRAALLDEAAWMLETGLVREGLHELDGLLARDRDDRRALALLSDLEVPAEIPEIGTGESAPSLEELLARAAEEPPCTQEFVLRRLLAHGVRHRNELERALLAERQSPDPARRAFGELALRRLFPARVAAR